MTATPIAIGFAAILSTTAASADEKEDEARVHFSAGVNLLRDPARPRYEEAFAEFKRAYQLAGSPKILANIGLCAMKLERDAEAIEAYSKYLEQVPDVPAEERVQVERDLATLKATLAKVTIESRPAGATILDTRVPTQGESITHSLGSIATRTEIGIRRGHHVMKARFDGGREVTWEADINGGESHVFELPASAMPTTTTTPDPGNGSPLRGDTGPSSTHASPFPRPVPTSVYVAGGVTLGLGVATLITGLVALNTHSKFEQRNDGNDPAGADDLRGTGETLNIATDVLLVGTLIGAGVTTYLFLTRPTVPSSTTPSLSGLRFRF
jgi:hypothetical protein